MGSQDSGVHDTGEQAFAAHGAAAVAKEAVPQPPRLNGNVDVMFEFMLDTGAVSSALRGQGAVPTRLLEHRPSHLCISSITLAGLKTTNWA